MLRVDLSRLRAQLDGRTVLITGAAGSIGSRLARTLRRRTAAKLVLLDASEHGLYRLGRDFPGNAEAPPARLVLGDLVQPSFIERILGEQEPEVVFHAAAYKHVSLLESQPLAALQNNVLGTLRLVRAASTCRLVVVSTDKAVCPTSVMGVTKRVGELALQRLRPANHGSATAVRLGNVLGSRGSVLPKFLRQIERGKPLTVTDLRATRHWMTAQEAVHLLLGGLLLGQGRDILLPSLGPPLGVLQLAQRVLRSVGEPGNVNQFVVTGLGPGEKLHERMWCDEEVPLLTSHPGILRIVSPLREAAGFETWARAFERVIGRADLGRAFEMLGALVPTYEPSLEARAALGRAA